MSVEYIVLNTGKHILSVQEKVGSKDGKAIFEQRQVVELNMKESEALASQNGFRCVQGKEEWVYAVIGSSEKKKGSFHPKRAWHIDEKKTRLVPINDIKTVSCAWAPEGES